MIILGITGVIGSGKSTVCGILQKKGFSVIDADEAGKYLLENSRPLRAEVKKEFGTLDKKELADIVFFDKIKLNKLNSIMHPQMKALIKERVELFKSKNVKKIAIEAAVFYEMDLKEFVDKVWLVSAKKETLQQRAMDIRRLAYATPKDALIKLADVIINNDIPLEKLEYKIENILNKRKPEKFRES